jgi:multidrug transporter EmrE-like cation transporter
MKILLAVLPTVFLAVYSQLMMKWRVGTLYMNPQTQATDSWSRVAHYFSDFWVLSAYITTFLGSIVWMFVVEKYDISLSFPTYIGLTFMLVVIGSCFLLKEPFTLSKFVAVTLIFLGILIGSIK